MSAAAIVILPQVWAVGERDADAPKRLNPGIAFYRKYTEGLLRRYVRMSMEVGRVPSLLGQEMFRGKVTNYRVESFEDVVIFVHDIEKCLESLEGPERLLISRMSLQEYTVNETATELGLKPKTVVRRHGQAIDHLTRIFLSLRLLKPEIACQEGEHGDFRLNC